MQRCGKGSLVFALNYSFTKRIRTRLYALVFILRGFWRFVSPDILFISPSCVSLAPLQFFSFSFFPFFVFSSCFRLASFPICFIFFVLSLFLCFVSLSSLTLFLPYFFLLCSLSPLFQLLYSPILPPPHLLFFLSLLLLASNLS